MPLHQLSMSSIAQVRRLFSGHPQNSRERCHPVGLEPTLLRGQTDHRTDLLQSFILGPRGHRLLLHDTHDILQPAPCDQLLHARKRRLGTSHLRDSRVELIEEDPDLLGGEDGNVVIVRLCSHVGDLEVSAGLEAGDGALKEERPVVDGLGEVAQVDEVEVVFGVGPLELDVVNLEFAVAGDPFRLDGRDVDADHFAFGVQVGEVDGPDTGAGADVEGTLDIDGVER